jgi:hypothetical protein
MDADLSHDPADVVRLLEALDEADLVIGSRYVPGGAIENWGAFRRRLSYYANLRPPDPEPAGPGLDRRFSGPTEPQSFAGSTSRESAPKATAFRSR